MKNGISVISGAYNEEKRIARFIRSFYKYDEIIILNRSSTDKTAEIARAMGATVLDVEYDPITDTMGQPDEVVRQRCLDAAHYPWLFYATMSDIVHPELTKQLYTLIDDPEFNKKYNRIAYPCVTYALGIASKHSVYDSKYRATFIKKSDVIYTNRVHEELRAKDEHLYTMKFDRVVALHHMSHETIDIAYDRMLRYSKRELNKNITCWDGLKYCFCRLAGGVKRRCWKLGWKGVYLMLSLVNYGITMIGRCVEKDLGDVAAKYNDIAREIHASDKGDFTFRNKEYESIEAKLGDSYQF